MKHNILKMLSFAFLVFTVTTSHAIVVGQEDNPKDNMLKPEIKIIDYGSRGWKLDLKLKQRFDRWENDLEDSTRYRISVEPDYKLKLSEYFYFDLNMGIGATIGSVQTRFGDLRANNFIFLKKSELFFRAANKDRSLWTKLSLGAINQAEFLNGFDIMVSVRALPGLKQHFKYENNYSKEKSFGLDVRAFQGIPASQSLNLNFNEKEDTPLYTNANLRVFAKDMNPDFGYRLGLNYGVYDYSELPSIIANESRLFGNTVSDFGPNAEFTYDFKGWYGGWDANLSFPRFEMRAFTQILTNTAAPDGQNQGQMAGGEFRYHDQHLNSWSLYSFTFFNEKDASVASYNSTILGHNNREGFGIYLAYKMKKRGLKFEARYIYSDIIEENGDLQIPSQFLGLRMEYKNEL